MIRHDNSIDERLSHRTIVFAHGNVEGGVLVIIVTVFDCQIAAAGLKQLSNNIQLSGPDSFEHRIVSRFPSGNIGADQRFVGLPTRSTVDKICRRIH